MKSPVFKALRLSVSSSFLSFSHCPFRRKKGKGSAAESHQLEYGDSRAYFSFQIYRKHQGVFATFGDWKYEEKRRERRGPCKNESHKVLNFAFYSVVSNAFKKFYNLQSDKKCSAKIICNLLSYFVYRRLCGHSHRIGTT